MNKSINLTWRRATRLWRILALAGVATGASASEGPLADKCNDNQFATNEVLAEMIRPELTGVPLLPGHRVPTRGTNPTESPELAGVTVILPPPTSFSFTSTEGLVAGSYKESIQASDTDGTCKQHTKLTMTAGCISKIRFHQYLHPLDIVADFRDDLPGKVPSKRASRSNDGLTFEFLLKRPVCAGESTRFLLLNTSILHMTTADALELVARDGTSAPVLFPVHVPAP